MKHWLLFLLLGFTLATYAQESHQSLVDKVLATLKIERAACLTDFIIEQSISDSESIIVIPEISEKGDEFISIDAHILIVNSKNGIINSRFFEHESWYSDAVRLNKIEVIYQPYKISKDAETVGILIDYYGSSRANPYSSKELSLFVRNGETLERVLKNFPIYTFNGETDGMNSGEFVEHEKTIRPIVSSKTKFYDLSITDSITATVSEDGSEKTIEKSEATEILNFTNGGYKKVNDK